MCLMMPNHLFCDELFSTVPLHFCPSPGRWKHGVKRLFISSQLDGQCHGITDYAESDGGLPVSSGIGFATGETGVASGALDLRGRAADKLAPPLGSNVMLLRCTDALAGRGIAASRDCDVSDTSW